MRALPLVVLALGIHGSLMPLQVSPTRSPRTSPKPANPSADPRHCRPCEVKVVLEEDEGKCKAVLPCGTDKVGHVAPGDEVRWVVQNDCSTEMKVGVSHFRRHSRATCTTPAEHAKHIKDEIENPLDPACANKFTPVPAHTIQAFGCGVRADLKFHPRTYKYDIVTPNGLLVDPEMEIYP